MILVIIHSYYAVLHHCSFLLAFLTSVYTNVEASSFFLFFFCCRPALLCLLINYSARWWRRRKSESCKKIISAFLQPHIGNLFSSSLYYTYPQIGAHFWAWWSHFYMSLLCLTTFLILSHFISYLSFLCLNLEKKHHFHHTTQFGNIGIWQKQKHFFSMVELCKLQKLHAIRQDRSLSNTVTRTTRRDEVEAEADMVAETITTDGKGRSSNLLINFSLFH